MSRATMVQFNYGQDMIKDLMREKLIVAVKSGKGYIVARWGVNKTTLKKEARRLFPDV